MLGSFLLPFRHLAFDNSRIDPVPPHLIIGALRLQLPQQTLIPLLQRLGSRAIAFRQPALEDLEAPQKRQPILARGGFSTVIDPAAHTRFGSRSRTTHRRPTARRRKRPPRAWIC